MKKIYSAANLMEARIMLDLLGHVGIKARLLNEHAQGGLGEISFTQAYPEVWLINEGDLERGRAVVSKYESSPIETGVVLCLACGEENPRNFQLCWHCGAGLERALHPDSHQ
jgi:Putative prokaryotic signal transducing protein